MSDALLSSAILLLALGLFVSDRIRPDAVALIVLLIAWLTGLLSMDEALDGFSSTAVLTVAAVLVVGRAIEFTGAAATITRFMVPRVPFVTVRLAGVLAMGVLLSAFMNNIAALVITMPAALAIAREHKLPPGAVLMPLSFATILGGMTTLIGTPANLIISSVREDELGAPFGMFSMTPVAGAVAVAGIVYLIAIGWRLTPRRPTAPDAPDKIPVLVFELGLPIGAIQGRTTVATARQALRGAGAVLLAVLRDGQRARLDADAILHHDDRLLVMSRQDPWAVAARARLIALDPPGEGEGLVTARVSVVHGSSLEGESYGAIEARTEGAVRVIAAGPRAAREKRPLASMIIGAGDQLFLHGRADEVQTLIRRGRLLEISRQAPPVRPGRAAMLVMLIYGAALFLSTVFGISTTAAFIAAALAICMLRLLPAEEAYRSIDLPVIVLIAALIPIGRAFDEAGGTTAIAGAIGWALSGAPLFLMLAVICALSMLLSIFLNNVATALVMAQVGLGAAATLGIDPDAALLAVLIGSSCDFLTPIGHHNNLLVMRPGGYLFRDYPRVGAPLSVIVILITAYVLSRTYGA
ncbi:MAG TPA: SLC13 family permease [Allosphingosinicella sp.]